MDGATYMVNNKVVPITQGLRKRKRHRLEIRATRVPEGISLEMQLVPGAADSGEEAQFSTHHAGQHPREIRMRAEDLRAWCKIRGQWRWSSAGAQSRKQLWIRPRLCFQAWSSWRK